MPTALTDIEWAATPLGMIVRGGFHPTPADAVPGAEPGEATLVLIGNAGSTLWGEHEDPRSARDGWRDRR